MDQAEVVAAIVAVIAMTLGLNLLLLFELAFEVEPKGPDRDIRLQRYGVVSACRNGGDAAERIDLDGGVPIRGCVVPELTVIVVPKGPDRAIHLQRHGVVRAWV